MPWLRLFVLVTAIGQILTSAFGGFSGRGSYSEPLITPAGYAFAIWGVITFGCLVYGIYQLLGTNKKSKLFDDLSLPASFLFLGFSLWILAAARDKLTETVLIFYLMLGCLYWIFSILKKVKKLNLFESVLIRGTFGLYFGWASVATVLNIVSALNFYHLIYPDQTSTGTYIFFLILDSVSAYIGLRFSDFNRYFFSTIVWAFLAVAIATNNRGAEILTYVTLGALLVISFFFLKYTRKNIIM